MAASTGEPHRGPYPNCASSSRVVASALEESFQSHRAQGTSPSSLAARPLAGATGEMAGPNGQRCHRDAGAPADATAPVAWVSVSASAVASTSVLASASRLASARSRGRAAAPSAAPAPARPGHAAAAAVPRGAAAAVPRARTRGCGSRGDGAAETPRSADSRRRSPPPDAPRARHERPPRPFHAGRAPRERPQRSRRRYSKSRAPDAARHRAARTSSRSPRPATRPARYCPAWAWAWAWPTGSAVVDRTAPPPPGHLRAPTARQGRSREPLQARARRYRTHEARRAAGKPLPPPPLPTDVARAQLVCDAARRPA